MTEIRRRMRNEEPPAKRTLRGGNGFGAARAAMIGISGASTLYLTAAAPVTQCEMAFSY